MTHPSLALGIPRYCDHLPNWFNLLYNGRRSSKPSGGGGDYQGLGKIQSNGILTGKIIEQYMQKSNRLGGPLNFFGLGWLGCTGHGFSLVSSMRPPFVLILMSTPLQCWLHSLAFFLSTPLLPEGHCHCHSSQMPPDILQRR